jgi:MoaA/NifB/PqqE/SkfB family radical SAM enzyme
VWLRVDQDWLSSATLDKYHDAELDEIAKWCNEQQCGKRMSYHMFQFDNEAEITMFLLKWS